VLVQRFVPKPMTKHRPLRSLVLYLALGLPVAASCAKEENSFDGDESGGSGGSGARAGSSSTAGTPSSAFGGTASSGGKSSAGSSAGGKAGAGEVGPELGGAGGTTAVPPDVLERATAIVLFKTDNAAASVTDVNMHLYIKNQSADPLPMANVKVRYWFTAEAPPTLHQYYAAQKLAANPPTFVDDGSNSHALMTFRGSKDGDIKMGEIINESEFQLALSTNQTPLDQSNDFSFDPTATTMMQPNPKVTLYLDDRLIWGCEPSGACAEDGAGGAGGMPGAAGAPGAAGMPNAGGMPGAGGVPGGAGAPDAGGMSTVEAGAGPTAGATGVP